MRSSNKNSNTNVLIKNTVMQYLMVVAQYVFPLITFPYMTRVLENEAYGVHTYMTSIITYFQLFVDFGFILSSTAQISKRRADKDAVQRIFSETILAKGILFVVSLIILAVLIPFQQILRQYPLISFLYMGTVFFSIFTGDFLFRGIEKMEVLTYRFIASKFVSTCLIFVLVRDSDDLIWVPILNAAGSFVAVVITWRYIHKQLNLKFVFPGIRRALSQIKDSVIYFVSNIATTAFGAFTTIIMGFALTPTQISFWGTSYNLISTVQSLYSPITNSLFPHMVKEKNAGLIKRILLIFMPLIVIGCTVCYFGATLIITIMCGRSYLESVPVFIYLIPVLFFSFPAMVIGFPYLGALGFTKDVTKTTVMAAVFHVVGLIVLFVSNCLALRYVAILRSMTEAVLLVTRLIYCFKRGLIISRKR